jgi:hypothetical protein
MREMNRKSDGPGPGSVSGQYQGRGRSFNPTIPYWELWEYGNMGIWEYGNMGIWEYGNMGMREYGTVGIWAVGTHKSCRRAAS